MKVPNKTCLMLHIFPACLENLVPTCMTISGHLNEFFIKFTNTARLDSSQEFFTTEPPGKPLYRVVIVIIIIKHIIVWAGS